MRLVLAALVLAAFTIVLGCSTGPDPDRLEIPSQLASVDSCEDVMDVMEAMDDYTLWSPDLSFTERLLVFERDHDSIKSLYQFHCGPVFKECSDADNFIEASTQYVSQPRRSSSSIIFLLLAQDFLVENECY